MFANRRYWRAIKSSNSLYKGATPPVYISDDDAYSLLKYHEVFILEHLYAGQFQEARYHSNVFITYFLHLLSLHRTSLFQNDINTALFALLSDNLLTIEKFGKLKNQKYEPVNQGNSVLYPIQCIVSDDFSSLASFKEKFIINNKERQVKDYLVSMFTIYWDAFASNDVELLQKAIDEDLLRYRNPVCDDFVRPEVNEVLHLLLPTRPLIYAKLAYIKGWAVNFDHPLVTEDLLQVKPLENFEFPYHWE